MCVAVLITYPSFMDPSAAAHPDSANSSPRSRHDLAVWPDEYDHHQTSLPPKLRLMCSFGGHIIPRPHDRSLCYVGGDTRIVVVDRTSSLAQLHSRLSHTLLHGRPFTLKYQLPTEDLDSLISLATDEDLDNMIDEYDRTTSAASHLKPSSRLRLFLFPSKPETAASMGSLLDDAKSETWFVDVLNGAGLLPRGLSDSAAIDHTLLEELDPRRRGGGMVNTDLEQQPPDQTESESSKQLQVASESSTGNIAQEAVLDSPPRMETNSSFGSSSSSPSMANLPPIKVRVEDYQTVGLEEQFSNGINMGNGAAPPVPIPFVTIPFPKVPVAENLNPRVIVYDEDQKSEKSDQGINVGLRRKPPLPLQPMQRKLVDVHNLPSPDSKHAGGYNLTSPDSVASDCSITSAGSLSSKNTVGIYQEASAGQPVNRESRASTPIPTAVIDQTSNSNNLHLEPAPSSSQLMESASILPPLQYQPAPPSLFHPGAAAAASTAHYIPISSYYPAAMYQHQAAAADPQYHPMYLLQPPLPQAQAQAPAAACYDPPTTAPTASRPLSTPLPNSVPQASYRDPLPPPIYTTKPPEMAAPNLYPLQVQFQQPYIGISHNHQIPPPAAAAQTAAPTYGYDHQYSHHQHVQVQQDHQAMYYGQPPPQYQTMTPAAAVMFSQSSTHQPQPPPDTAAAASAQQS